MTLSCVVASVWLVLSGSAPLASARTCTSCASDVSVEFLLRVVRPALEAFYATDDAALELDVDRKLGGAVRMLFHDTGTFDASDATGRANGCFLEDDGGNAGLDPITPALSALYASLEQRERWSRADFWQYAGLVAIDVAQANALAAAGAAAGAAAIPALPGGSATAGFRFGRSDAADCATTGFISGTFSSLELERNRLPPPATDFIGLQEIFIDRMGLSVREMVALSGAHTLGISNPEGSGHAGKWVRNNAALDVEYFSSMLDVTWTRETVLSVGDAPEEKFQWRPLQNDVDDLVMLNTDLSLVYGVGFNDLGCQVTTACLLNRDGNPQTAREVVTEYAGGDARNATAGLEAWFADFVPALRKLGELGFETLLEPCELAAECLGGVPNNGSLVRRQFTMLMDDSYRESYHGGFGFRALLTENVGDAFGVSASRVVVDSVFPGSVVARVSVYLDPIEDAQQLAVFTHDDVVLRALQEQMAVEERAGLVGPLKLVRLDQLDGGGGQGGGDAGQLDEALLGPFQSQRVDATATIVGAVATAFVIVCLSSAAMCCVLHDEDPENIERQDQEAKDQRKKDRLATLAPKPFSKAATAMSYTTELDINDDSTSSSDDEEHSSSSSKSSRRHKKHKHRKSSK